MTPAEKAARAVELGKKPPTALVLAVASRLRVVQSELQLTDERMSELLSVSRSAYSNWLALGNLPDEAAMIILCERTGITLDWLYRGDTKGVRLDLIIRLTARMKGLNPDEATVQVLAE